MQQSLLQVRLFSTRAVTAKTQMLLEGGLGSEGMIPDTRDPDQSGVEEGKIRYTLMGQKIELPECSTDGCWRKRACFAHHGDEEGCYEVPKMCSTCGDRKPCYYAFGKCRLRNGYGPKTVIQPRGNASAIMGIAGNATQRVSVDARAVRRVLRTLQPQYHKHLRLWDWKTRRYITNHHYNENVRRRWIRRKTGKYVPAGSLDEANAAADAKDVQLEWCNWGEEMVPCAPGFGGAWYAAGHRSADYGIWPLEEESGPTSESPHEVYAGKRSESYFGHHNPIPQTGDLLYGSSKHAQPPNATKEEDEEKEEK